MLASAKLKETLTDPEFCASRSVDHTAFRKALGSNAFAYYHSVSYYHLLPFQISRASDGLSRRKARSVVW
jgi:hypothetical protein